MSGYGRSGLKSFRFFTRAVLFSRSMYKTTAYSKSAKNTNTMHESSHTSIAFTLSEGGAEFLKINVFRLPAVHSSELLILLWSASCNVS
jgi:hypothetical protein